MAQSDNYTTVMFSTHDRIVVITTPLTTPVITPRSGCTMSHQTEIWDESCISAIYAGKKEIPWCLGFITQDSSSGCCTCRDTTPIHVHQTEAHLRAGFL